MPKPKQVPGAPALPDGQHPIRVAARRAGLSPDVLRAWERRYQLVAPSRSGTGRRLYSDADVERLRLIAVAARAGRRISDLATLSSEELQRLCHQSLEGNPPIPRAVKPEPAADVRATPVLGGLHRSHERTA